MTNLQTVKKELDAIHHVVNVEKVALAWLDKDGYVYPHSNKFDHPDRDQRFTPEGYAVQVKREGYAKLILIKGW